MTRKPLFIACALLLAPLSASALSFGQIKVNSALNQPLDADIEIVSVGGEDLHSLSAGLASTEAFAQSGLDRTPLMSDLKFSVQTRDNGKTFIKVTSSRPVREPMVDFLVQLEWSKGRYMREFAILLDPPKSVLAAARTPVAPVITRAAPPPPPPSTPAKVPRPTPPMTLATNVPRGTETYGPVPRGDTLWSIASRVRPDASISTRRMMDALFAANPDAFARSNMNRLLAGTTLRVPSAQEIDPALDASRLSGRPPQAPKAAPPPPKTVQPQQPAVHLVPPDTAAETVRQAPVATTTPVMPMVPSAPIKLDEGHLKLKVAGLEDVRNRINSMVAVNNPALTAIQESTKAPKPTTETAPAQAIAPAPAAGPAESPSVTAAPPAAPTSKPGEPNFQESLPKNPPVPTAPAAPPATAGQPPQTVAAATPPAAVPAPGVSPAPVAAQPPAVTQTPPEPPKTATEPASTQPAATPATQQSVVASAQPPSAASGPQPTAAPAVAPSTSPAPTPAPAPDKTAAAEAPKTKPVNLAEPKETPSGWVQFDNPTTWATGFGLLLLMGLGAFLIARRKPEEPEDLAFEPVTREQLPKREEKAAPSVDLDRTVPQAVVTKPTPKSSTRPTANTLERVDLLLAIGNYTEAENTLRLAMKENPQDNAMTAKLLDIYSATRNKDKFLQEAQAFRDRLGNDTDPLWVHTVRMGRELYPGHVLFGGVTAAPQINTPKPVEFDSSDLDAPTRTTMGDRTAPDSSDLEASTRTAMGSQTAPDSFDDLDAPTRTTLGNQATPDSFDDLDAPTRTTLGNQAAPDGLDWDAPTRTTLGDQALPAADTSALPGLEPPTSLTDKGEAEPSAQPAAPTDNLNTLNWQLPDLEPVTRTPDQVNTKMIEELLDKPTERPGGQASRGILSPDGSLQPPGGSGELGFEFDNVPTQGPERGPLEFNVESLDLRPEPVKDDKAGDKQFSATEEYVETKLDLAMAYLEMGDPVGARGLLEEVLREGSPAQKQRAQEFMTQLG